MHEMESGLAFGKAVYSFGFRVVDLKHGEELGDLQDFLELAAEMAEAESCALRLGAVVRGDQGAETGAVDEGDVVHVEDNVLFPVSDQRLDLLAQRVAF